jgi:hypothetical protein
MGLETVGGRKRGDQIITPPTAAAASATLPRFRQLPPARGGELSFLAKTFFQYIPFFMIVICWYIVEIE